MSANVKISTRRVIWTCKCGTKAHDYVSTRRSMGTDKMGVTRWTEAVLTRVVDGAARSLSADAWCDACRGYRKAATVVGRVSAHKCGARCTHAKGGDCECECGGANHGRGWM